MRKNKCVSISSQTLIAEIEGAVSAREGGPPFVLPRQPAEPQRLNSCQRPPATPVTSTDLLSTFCAPFFASLLDTSYSSILSPYSCFVPW